MPRWIGCSLSWLLLCGSMALAQEAGVAESYSSQIKPLLTKHCAKCHGSQKQMSSLRIDSAKGLLDGGGSMFLAASLGAYFVVGEKNWDFGIRLAVYFSFKFIPFFF